MYFVAEDERFQQYLVKTGKIPRPRHKFGSWIQGVHSTFFKGGLEGTISKPTSFSETELKQSEPTKAVICL